MPSVVKAFDLVTDHHGARGSRQNTREDILDLYHPVLAHRIVIDHRAGSRGMTSRKILDALVDEVCAEAAPEPTSTRMKALLLAMRR